MKRPKGAAGGEGPLHAALPACTGKAAGLPHAAGPWFGRRVLSRERSGSPGSASSTQSSECCAEVPERVSVSPSVLCAPLTVRSCVGFLASTGTLRPHFVFAISLCCLPAAPRIAHAAERPVCLACRLSFLIHLTCQPFPASRSWPGSCSRALGCSSVRPKYLPSCHT